MKKLGDDLIDDKYTEVLVEEEFNHHAPHNFEVRASKSKSLLATIHFQEGAINEHGVNGVTHEDLIAMMIVRLESFQKSPFKCRENENAISALEETMYWLRKRTREREARQVEGTHIV